MKRVLILLLSAVLMTAALTGCSSGEEDALVSKTPFPEFSAQDLATGEYTKGIDTWFADTFPLRDVFSQVNGWVQSFYGVKTVIITGTVEQGDEIPDAPFTGNK